MKQKRADEGGVPWCIQPELVEGCSMRYGTGPGGLCSFCGITAIRKGPGDYKCMTVELARCIAEECGDFCPKARVEFAMRGEPLMNPHHLEIFANFRRFMSKAQMMVTTNGDTLRGHMKERADKIFDAGVNFILLDTYYPEERRIALREEAFALEGITVFDFYRDWVSVISPYHNHGNKYHRVIVLMDDLLARDGQHSSRVVKTHAGANMMKTLDKPLVRNCGRPFREMTIAWNGDVTLCCDDWRKEYIVGNVTQQTMKSIWIDPRMEAARARLMQKDRAWGPCAQCDSPSAPRTSLLPVYGPPTMEQIKLTEDTFVSKQPVWKRSK